MIRPEHIYGDSTRLFLNVELGCASACTYCYLPTEGFKIGLKKSDTSDRIGSKLLIQTLLEDKRTILGPEGTLFSIGCFSEAWDPRNRQATTQIIKALLKFGNPLQMATKRKVNARDLRRFTCRVPCDHVPRRSWPLFKARAVLRGLLASNDLESTS